MTSVCSISRLLMRAWAPVSCMVGCFLLVGLVEVQGCGRPCPRRAEKTPRRGEGRERTGARRRRALGNYEDGGRRSAAWTVNYARTGRPNASQVPSGRRWRDDRDGRIVRSGQRRCVGGHRLGHHHRRRPPSDRPATPRMPDRPVRRTMTGDARRDHTVDSIGRSSARGSRGAHLRAQPPGRSRTCDRSRRGRRRWRRRWRGRARRRRAASRTVARRANRPTPCSSQRGAGTRDRRRATSDDRVVAVVGRRTTSTRCCA